MNKQLDYFEQLAVACASFNRALGGLEFCSVIADEALIFEHSKILLERYWELCLRRTISQPPEIQNQQILEYFCNLSWDQSEIIETMIGLGSDLWIDLPQRAGNIARSFGQVAVDNIFLFDIFPNEEYFQENFDVEGIIEDRLNEYLLGVEDLYYFYGHQCLQSIMPDNVNQETYNSVEDWILENPIVKLENDRVGADIDQIKNIAIPWNDRVNALRQKAENSSFNPIKSGAFVFFNL